VRAWITDRWMAVDKTTGKRSVRKADYGRGSRWQVSFYEEQGDGSRNLRSRKFDKRSDAEAFRTRTEHELRSGIYEAPQDLVQRFDDAAQAWWESKRRPTGASLHRYRAALDIWILPTWSTRTLASIARPDIETWVTQLVAGSAPSAPDRRTRSGGFSPAGLRAVWVPFNATLGYAHRIGWITGNPARGVELPRTLKPVGVYLTYVEVERLLTGVRAVTGRLDDEVMIELMAYAGLRPGEVVALQVGDVDLTGRRIKITKTATIDLQGRPVIGEPKHGERREVPIAPHLVDPLLELTRGRDREAPLVTAIRGSVINTHNWRYRVWNPAVKAAALPQAGLTPKTLRHTAASMAIAAGADVKVVQRMLGHADATMTLNTYAELWPDRLDDVSNAMTRQRSVALGLDRSDGA
jgi:integrase